MLIKHLILKQILFLIIKEKSSSSSSYLNCTFNAALNSEVISKILRSKSRSSSSSEIDLMELESSSVNKSLAIDTIEAFTSHQLVQFLIESISDEANKNNIGDLFDLLLNKFGMSTASNTFILAKIDSLVKKTSIPVEFFNKLCETNQISLKYIIQIIESLLKKSDCSKVKPGSVLLEKLKQISTEDNQMQVDSDIDIDIKLSAFPFSRSARVSDRNEEVSEETKLNDVMDHNEYSMTCLNNIEAQIEEIKSKRMKEMDRESNEMVYEDISQSPETHQNKQEALELLIKGSKPQNLERNMNSFFDSYVI